MQGRRILIPKKFERVFAFPAGFVAFAIRAELRGFVLFEQVEDDAAENEEILRYIEPLAKSPTAASVSVEPFFLLDLGGKRSRFLR
jgi:hypothetical protein